MSKSKLSKDYVESFPVVHAEVIGSLSDMREAITRIELHMKDSSPERGLRMGPSLDTLDAQVRKLVLLRSYMDGRLADSRSNPKESKRK